MPDRLSRSQRAPHRPVTEPHDGGTGLGLSVVAAPVAAQGANASLDGSPGAGPCCCVELALADARVGSTCVM
jgi:signal transduction histidine kinase